MTFHIPLQYTTTLPFPPLFILNLISSQVSRTKLIFFSILQKYGGKLEPIVAQRKTLPTLFKWCHESKFHFGIFIQFFNFLIKKKKNITLLSYVLLRISTLYILICTIPTQTMYVCNQRKKEEKK